MPPLLAESGTGLELGLVVSSFLFGFRHGIDWDHIAAITDITSSQDNRRDSIVFGTIYALGHALVVFVIGSIAIVLGENLPEGVDRAMERVVGATLVILGIYVFVALVRHGREFRMRSRWMLIFSGVRGVYRRLRPSAAAELGHEPVHVHTGQASAPVAIADDIPVSEWHHGHHGRPGHHHHTHPEPDAFMNYGRRTAFLVGMIHGVGAETPTQLIIFLTVAGAGGHLAGELLLGTFLLGLLSSNTLITVGTAFGFVRASKNWTLYVVVAVLTATFSLVIGTLFLLGRGTVLPALFGG
jgi:high-affinity nickel-transport protein